MCQEIFLEAGVWTHWTPALPAPMAQEKAGGICGFSQASPPTDLPERPCPALRGPCEGPAPLITGDAPGNVCVGGQGWED